MLTDEARTDPYSNPFSVDDPDRRKIWQILIVGDLEPFLSADWSAMEPDFCSECFFGIDARQSPNPDQWRISFPDVPSYRDEWLRQAREFELIQLSGITKREFLCQCVRLDDIEIVGDRAIAHKKFNGSAQTADGNVLSFCFQSLFQMVRRDGHWKIAGFIGYLPNPMNGVTEPLA